MNKKFSPTIKSVLIIALAMLAVFQVSHLWLVNFTNRNFFLYLQARFPPTAPDGASAFAQPFRIISGVGDGRFDMRYSDIAGSDEWEFGKLAVNSILQSGVLVSADEISFESVLQRPVLIYEYAFDMCAETFSRALGRRSGTILTDAGIETFRAIAVQPPEAQSSSPVLRVFFISDARIWEYSFLFGNPQRALSYTFEVAPTNALRKHFVATEGGFVPHVALNGFSYRALTAENPFRDPQGLFTLSHVRSRVEPFFDNPATIIPSVSVENVYTFSNRNTLVRYLENAVLEYTSYRTIGRAVQGNLIADFSAALAFVNDDPFVINEIFLQNHETRHGRSHVFWFDYVIDNRPLIMTQKWYTRPYPRCSDPLLAPIEVTVDQGRVVRYRRLAYTFHLSPDILRWKEARDLDMDGYFTLGFPIGSGPIIELEVLY